jgi:hypothetical protein
MLSLIPPGAPLLADTSGIPIVYRALGVYFHLESLGPDDVPILDEVNALVLDWIGPALRFSLHSTWAMLEPFRPEDLDYIPGYASDLERPTDHDDDPDARDAEGTAAGFSHDNFGLACHGGAEEHHASPYSYRFYSQVPEDWPAKLLPTRAMIRITVPLEWPLDDFAARACAIAGKLRLRWGAAGLTYSGWEVHWYNDVERTTYAHARRYTGYDVGEYVTLMDEWHRQIRTVSWLTFIGPALGKELSLSGNGRSGRLVEVSRAGQNVLLRAGAQPEEGDINRLAIPPAYMEADAMVRPVRARERINFFESWTEATTTEWLTRFERRIR